jgi:hypothetical protein
MKVSIFNMKNDLGIKNCLNFLHDKLELKFLQIFIQKLC